MDKTFFVRSWLSTGKKKKNSQTQTNPSPTLENEGVTDGTERRVGGEAIVGQISTIPEMRSLWKVTSLGSQQTSIDGFMRSESGGNGVPGFPNTASGRQQAPERIWINGVSR